MLRKPIRTYEKKNTANPLLKINDSVKLNLISKTENIIEEQHGIDLFKGNRKSEDLLDYDPFETTFDRIAKDAVVPPIPLDCINNDSWSGSSSDMNNEEENNYPLFQISFGDPNVVISPNVKHKKTLKLQSYTKNVKLKNKKAFVTGILNDSQHIRKIRKAEKKKNQTKTYKSKKVKIVPKTRNKKRNESNNTENSYSMFKNSTSQLCKPDILDTDVNSQTNNENIINNSIVSYNSSQKNNIDLYSKPLSPLREITNNTKINDRKKTVKSNKKKKNILHIENNENLSLTSSILHDISDSVKSKFKIKPCSVILYKDNLKKFNKFIINKHVIKECYISLNKISSNTFVDSEYKLPMNDLKSQCKNSNKINKDFNSIINPISSTPINTLRRKAAYSLCYSPIDIDSSTKNINHADEEKTVFISHTSALLETSQSNNLHVLNRTNKNTSVNVESDTKDKISYTRDRKIRELTSNDNFLSSDDIKINEQEREILHLGDSKQSSNFINNREAHATTFADDSIEIALRRNNKTSQEDKLLLNHVNYLMETHSRSISLFDDYESKLHTLENDNKISAITKKSFVSTNVDENNANTCELEYKSITLDKDNTEKIIKSEILKEEPPITITKEKSIEEYIENEDKDIKEISSNQLMDESHVFFRLKNSKKITKRRQRQEGKRKFNLSDICENENNINLYSQYEMKPVLIETSQFNEKLDGDILCENTIKNSADTSVNITTHCDELNSLKNKEIPNLSKKHIYLKSGKSWARSLSILCNFQNGLNLNSISIKKGKKWRHSVKDVLDMQKEGPSSRYTEINDYLNRSPLYNRSKTKFFTKLTTDVCDTSQFANSKKIIRRTSIRVVRDSKIIKNASDTLFLKVYGIKTDIQDRLTLSQTNCETEYSNHNNDVESNFEEFNLSKTAKDVILQKCSQQNYLPFSEIFSTSYLKFCRKIGEGVYGEVFLYEKEEQKSVLKIIPIEGDQLVNGEPQKKFNEILSEIVIAKELYNLRFNKNHNTNGFVELKSIKCIEGKYPEEMLELWKNYDDEKSSENDCPSIFDEKQLYISLELGHGGQSLESFIFQTAEEAYASFIQIALALAVAERSLKFEHRDLHWGNILISPTNEQYIYYKLDKKNISVPSNGVKICIIDFTLSRMSYQGCCIFNDLALDPALFTAQGEYQFQIYRLMKDAILNNWKEFEPRTNVLWLHYIVDKMITMVKYKKKNLKKHKNAITLLKDLKEVILLYQSAFDLVKNCDKISNLLIYNKKSMALSC
ncbi:hypothetical protein M0802_005088 [Mischocyttarus mexicanus]|nr:hypothetical protein M0802_005088 [Mischocyttarus mexicanus]